MASPPRRVVISPPNKDNYGVFLEPRYEAFSAVSVPGQSKAERHEMVARLRRLGFLDDEEYITVKDFIVSLSHLHQRQDLLFVLDSKVFNFLLGGWTRDSESMFDFGLSSKIYDDIIAKLASNERANVPKRQTYYGRDLVGTVAEWYFFRWSDFIPSCVVMDTYASFVCVYLHVFRCIESL